MTGSFIEQYEKAVLEWFNVAYPRITEMVYAKDTETLLALRQTLVYPCLSYHREDDDHVLPKALEVFDEDCHDKRKAKKSVIFSTIQGYEATLYLNNEEDLYKVSNVIRQRWYRDSYVTIAYPHVDQKVRVGMYLKGFHWETDRTNVNQKGPVRKLKMAWQSTLILEAAYSIPRPDGFRLYIEGIYGGEVKEDRLLPTEPVYTE